MIVLIRLFSFSGPFPGWWSSGVLTFGEQARKVSFGNLTFAAMSLKDIFNKAKKEAEVLQGKDAKDKQYGQENAFPDEAAASAAFARSKEKLFAIDQWSRLPGINSTFELYDAAGRKSAASRPREGDYMKVVLPGLPLENWVQVVNVREEDQLAEFTVRPSPAPATPAEAAEVKHFFTSEATSTFRVEQRGTTLRASEIGKNEKPNNQVEASGARSVVNTLVAEGGWAGFQALQWGKLTAYLVHLVEASE
jgi:hypothetical protein